MAILQPTKVRLSPHFLLSDMMGCTSIYAMGLANVFDKQPGTDIRLENAKALCEYALEPILAAAGPISISYGFISPSVSKELVHYQDWRKPSHHRFDLGAAVDICPHKWVQRKGANEDSAPVTFALQMAEQIPFSRIITYAESPFICVAVAAEEVEAGTPRGAFYENRFAGKKGAKPLFLKYGTPQARQRAWQRLEDEGLPVGWKGAGYPTYHGGGNRQMHHIRLSKYSMLTDFLFDEEWVTQGAKNIPSLNDQNVDKAFKRAGAIYDTMLDTSGLPRLSIVSAYTSPKSAGWIAGRDWRDGKPKFEVVPPEYFSPEALVEQLHGRLDGVTLVAEEDRVYVEQT